MSNVYNAIAPVVYNVGPDSLGEDHEFDDNSYQWVVCFYKQDGYEGDGHTYALGFDGKLYVYTISHCSCNGPTDDWGKDMSVVTLEEFFRDEVDITIEDAEPEAKVKVAELLGLSSEEVMKLRAGVN